MSDDLDALRIVLLAASIAKSLPPSSLRALCLELRDSHHRSQALQHLLGASSGSALSAAELEFTRCKNHGIDLLALFEPDYPASLLQMFDPPVVLFVRGKLTTRYNVGIVGARAASEQGRNISHQLAKELTRRGAVIVSGLAHGIDAEAHRGAICGYKALAASQQSETGAGVAVLGSGLLAMYPAANRQLAETLIQCGGALVSEFLPLQGPRQQHFPQRNRIIAGLSETIVVVEAKERSGALITARFAHEIGRQVMAVPSGLDNPLGVGPNRLIRDGAAIVCEVADILELAPAEKRSFVWPAKQNPHSTPARIRPEEANLIRLFELERTLSLDSIVERLQEPVAEIRAKLMDLELRGEVILQADGLYRLPASLTGPINSSNFEPQRTTWWA